MLPTSDYDTLGQKSLMTIGIRMMKDILSFSQRVRSMPAVIYNYLPGETFERLFLSRFYRLTQLYALDKMVTHAELLQEGISFIELEDGTKFYGEQDDVTSPRDVTHGVIQKLDKLRKFECSRKMLGVLCSQYVKTEYEKCYQLSKGDVVIDAGAHIGTFTVKAAKAVGNQGKVIAIEPEANNLQLLSRNVKANGLQNVSIVPKGVWESKGRLKLNISCKRTTGHSFYRDAQFGTKDTKEFREVEVDTVDNIIRQLGIGPVNFIKMDIEGAEIEAIKGMDETLGGDVNLAIEGCHIIAGLRTYQVVIPWLKKMGVQVRRNGRIIYAKKRN